MKSRIARALVGALVGGAAGLAIAAVCRQAGFAVMPGKAGTAIAYGGAIAVAVLVLAGDALRHGRARVARPIWPSAVLAVLVVFVARRWWAAWVNAIAIEWGAGPGGEMAILVLPLVGVICGAAGELDGDSFKGEAAGARTREGAE